VFFSSRACHRPVCCSSSELQRARNPFLPSPGAKMTDFSSQPNGSCGYSILVPVGLWCDLVFPHARVQAFQQHETCMPDNVHATATGDRRGAQRVPPPPLTVGRAAPHSHPAAVPKRLPVCSTAGQADTEPTATPWMNLTPQQEREQPRSTYGRPRHKQKQSRPRAGHRRDRWASAAAPRTQTEKKDLCGYRRRDQYWRSRAKHSHRNQRGVQPSQTRAAARRGKAKKKSKIDKSSTGSCKAA